MYSLIIFLPLLSTCIIAFAGRALGQQGANLISVGHMVIAWFLALLLFWEVTINQSILFLSLGPWIPLPWGSFQWGLIFDGLTSGMILVVCSISGLVHFYSVEYMNGDPHRPRFMCYLSFFTFFMLILVSSHNLLQMFVGWEGVGLCSYLLIGFWFTRIEANKSAIKAMVVNRVGDLGLLLGIFGLWYSYGTVNYASLKGIWLTQGSQWWLELFIVFLLIGAVGKSAQLGLHTWLPDAMEGPTPVSALIHAATMVTAGVFLLIRMSALLEIGTWSLILVGWVGAFTALFAGTVGVFQQDLKKVIAYSTCSQLGYMVAACGLSLYSVGLFHLTTHAFFKALLFLGAGSIIHALKDEQDFRAMGGIGQQLPLSYLSISVGSLALVGFPFLAGYFSKDLLLEMAYGCFWKQEIYLLLWLAALCTAFYSFRLLWHTFLISPRSSLNHWSQVTEGVWPLWLPLVILISGSITVGYGLQVALLGPFYPIPLTWAIKSLPLMGLLSMVLLGTLWFSWSWWNPQTTKITQLFTFFNQAWLFNTLNNTTISYPTLQLSHLIAYRLVDRGLLEKWGPTGLYNFLTGNVQLFSLLQSGKLYHYTLTMILGLILMYGLII